MRSSRTVILAIVASAVLSATAVVPVYGGDSLILAQSDTAEISFWESVKDTKDPAELEAYLGAYPNGKFAPLAKIRLTKLKPAQDNAAQDAAPPMAQSPAAETVQADTKDSLAQVVERVSPQVVIVTASVKTGDRTLPDLPKDSPFKDFFDDFFSDRSTGRASASTIGSGFIYSETGHVVTSIYAVDKADTVEVVLADGRTIEADIVGKDPETSVALLKLRGGGPYPTVTFGDSSALQVGEQIIVIGNSGGLAGTVKTGIVSGLHRNINAGPYDDYIQTDQDLATSQTGAPVFDRSGSVTGMVSVKFKPKSGAGSSLAVPIEMVRRVAEDLVKYGKTRRGWLGLRIQSVTDELAESLKLNEAAGALVAGVTAGGPAADADLKAGDVIVAFGGKKIVEMRELLRQLANTPVDSTVEVEIVRDGQTITKSITIGPLKTATANVSSEPAPPPASGAGSDQRTVRLLGLTLEPISSSLRAKFGNLRSATGGVVTAIDSGSASTGQKLAAGDVIVEVAMSPVTSPAEIAAKLEEESGAGRKTVLLSVSRGDSRRFVALGLEGLDVQYGTAMPSQEDNTVMSIGDVQRYLTDLGYDPGPADGKMGRKTRAAIREFQNAQLGMTADGEISADLSRALRNALASKDAPASKVPQSSSINGPGDDLKSLESLD